MAKQDSNSYAASVSTPTSSPIDLVDAPGFDVQSEQAQKLVAWVHDQQTKAKNARQSKVTQWAMNMAFVNGEHWAELTPRSLGGQFGERLFVPKKPYYYDRKTVNRTRSFMRTELSKFTSQSPSATVIPASAEDEAVRAAYAAEQAWESIQDSQKYSTHYAAAAWWTIITGNGFIKTWWDTTCVDPMNPDQPGMIRFGSVTPFNLFIPDLREQEIEDQPFVINAYKKSAEWVSTYYSKQLDGRTVSPSSSSDNQLTDRMLNLNEASNTKDSVTLYEAWIKPSTCKHLPNGGVVIMVDDVCLSVSDGWPYDHGQYPFTKFEHIPTATFYAETPLTDVIPLQREYNKLRTDISEAGRRMAKPQLLAQRGSVVPSKITNEPGLVIEYRPGFQPPVPMTLVALPQYYINQQEVILADIEEITGQHDVSKGNAPAGVTAGTAINYLQESADQFLTPEYQSIERGTSRIGSQALQLFVQYVDLDRKIQTVGADNSFDVTLINGQSIKDSTALRVEPGSSISHSKAANDAKVMDYFSVGIIDQPTAARMLELGGVQRFQDIMQTAEKKAQRENTKMKMLDPAQLGRNSMAQAQQLLSQPPADPATGEPMDLTGITPEQLQAELPPVVTVADFDVHEIHIETHNRFRMSQEYEALDPVIQNQFEKHVAEHQKMYMQGQMMNFLQQVPSDGTDQGGPADASVDPNADPSADPSAGTSADPSQMVGDPNAGGPSMSGNGAVGAPPTSGASLG
jgi:hypothetical protein